MLAHVFASLLNVIKRLLPVFVRKLQTSGPSCSKLTMSIVNVSLKL